MKVILDLEAEDNPIHRYSQAFSSLIASKFLSELSESIEEDLSVISDLKSFEESVFKIL